MTKIINLDNYIVEEKNALSEEVAQSIIAKKGQVLMIFEKGDDKSKYGYIATEFTDLGHAKKVTINRFIQFERVKNI